jgi:hypothetical protein
LKLTSNAACIASTSLGKASTSILVLISRLSSNSPSCFCAELDAWIFFFIQLMPRTLSAITKWHAMRWMECSIHLQ